jgi:cardiolipin synthase
MNLPNSITIARLVSVPLIGWLIVGERFGLALVGFAVAAASDALDGILARVLNQRTALGAVLDPAADKLLVVTAQVGLAWVGLLPVWLVLIVFVRDFLLSAAYWIAFGMGRRLPVQPTLLGKGTTVLHLLVVIWLLATATRVGVEAATLPSWIYLGAAALTLLSGLDYVRTGYVLLRKPQQA